MFIVLHSLLTLPGSIIIIISAAAVIKTVIAVYIFAFDKLRFIESPTLCVA